MKRYKLHQSYNDSTGKYIAAGEYDENQIDVAEARYRSIITQVSSNIQVEDVKQPDTINIVDLSQDDPTGVKTVKIEPKKTQTKVKTIKINKASVDDIAALKYVSKKQAELVEKLRSESKFESYNDINERIPLGFNRKWEDISALDFEYNPPTIDNNSYSVTSTASVASLNSQ